MSHTDDHLSEQERIRSVYQSWLAKEAGDTYAWHRPEVMDQDAVRRRAAGAMLARTLGPDLSQSTIVDVGCGSGGFLRQLIDWGADPRKLTGTEYLPERLAAAALRSAPGVRWHLGDLDIVDDASVDLIVANTVFSSILDSDSRHALACAMWRTLKPGGWCMIFDFRYDNPRNKFVRRVSRAELRAWWPASQAVYRSLVLAPPIARRLARAPRMVGDVLVMLAPVLRSHFLYLARKGD